jgi:hypothetical protein
MAEKATGTLYEQDFAAWAEQQARALRERRWEDVDLEHVAEEIESMGSEQESKLESYLEILILHLLKWQFQPIRRNPSWRRSMAFSRARIERVLRKNPSLKARLADLVSSAHADALRIAAIETGLSEKTFPRKCPYAMQQLRDQDFLPDA